MDGGWLGRVRAVVAIRSARRPDVASIYLSEIKT
jgi:hypothetical protein